MLARLMPREIKADVNTAYSLVECLREIDEREANAKEGIQFLFKRKFYDFFRPFVMR